MLPLTVLVLFFFFGGAGTRLWSSRVFRGPLLPMCLPSALIFFFSHTPSQVVELPSLHESFWVD